MGNNIIKKRFYLVFKLGNVTIKKRGEQLLKI